MSNHLAMQMQAYPSATPSPQYHPYSLPCTPFASSSSAASSATLSPPVTPPPPISRPLPLPLPSAKTRPKMKKHSSTPNKRSNVQLKLEIKTQNTGWSFVPLCRNVPPPPPSSPNPCNGRHGNSSGNANGSGANGHTYEYPTSRDLVGGLAMIMEGQPGRRDSAESERSGQSGQSGSNPHDARERDYFGGGWKGREMWVENVHTGEQRMDVDG